MPDRYRLNVVGDFYVEDGCCTFCGVPFATAPELFGGFEPDGSILDETEQCWVKKQPSSSSELAAMIETMRTQELGCIRYAGSNPAILRRLREVNVRDEIDEPESARGMAPKEGRSGPHRRSRWWPGVVLVLGSYAWIDSTVCSVATFATNDYRPILLHALAAAAVHFVCVGVLLAKLTSRWRFLLLVPAVYLLLLIPGDVGRLLAR